MCACEREGERRRGRERESGGESKSFDNEEIRNKPPVVSVVVLGNQ